ncbi:MAG: imelysin family protein [Chloroflexota bacterium]
MKLKQKHLPLLIGILLVLTACTEIPPAPTASEISSTVAPPTEMPQVSEAVTETTPTAEPDVEPVEEPTIFVDRQTMLTQIVEQSILPLHEALVIETILLEETAHQFQSDTTVENLDKLQTQWQSTALAWAKVEHLGFRFTMIIHNQIKKWPVKLKFIEKFIADETIVLDEPYIESIGSTSKGITAIEYLIFQPEMSQAEVVETLTNQPRRVAYMVASTENLSQKSQKLLELWSPDGANRAQAFIDADFSDDNLQGSISMLANEMIVQIEELANTRLNDPRKGAGGAPDPNAVESPYAQFSAPLMANNLRGLQQTFESGLDDYLDFLQRDQTESYLSERISQQFETAIFAVDAISPSVYTAVLDNPDTVTQAFEEVKTLLILFKVDMAGQMGITVTFSDNDGD